MTEGKLPLPPSLVTKKEEEKIPFSLHSAFEVSSPVNRAKRSQSLTTTRPDGWIPPPSFTPNRNSALFRLTIDLVNTYQNVGARDFRYTPTLNPRRVLTKISEPVSNDNCDNINSDYILYVNDIIGCYSGHQYRVLDLLGQGTFGQVVKAINSTTKEQVAIKIVKNKPTYFNQGLVEIQILEMLNHQFDPENKHHIVRLMDYFVFRSHLCLVFELLSINLYELLKQNNFKGLSVKLLHCFLTQILDALSTIGQSDVLHCDLKPENILLQNLASPTIKIIDFGSACFENRTVYSYIQSRFYRSPEVLLGTSYSWGIDMWSLGCIAAELFLGLPLLPGSSEYNQIYRIVDMFGELPENLLVQGEKAHKYFDPPGKNGRRKYSLKSEEEYAKENNIPVQPSKKYFKFKTLKDIITNYSFKEGLSPEDIEKEKQNRISFIDFLGGLLQLDPEKRWTADQALKHPFMTCSQFTSPFVPPPRVPGNIKPRIIPWGIVPSALTQRPVSMSFPENYLSMDNYTPHQGIHQSSFHQVPMMNSMNLANSPPFAMGGRMAMGIHSFDSSTMANHWGNNDSNSPRNPNMHAMPMPYTAHTPPRSNMHGMGSRQHGPPQLYPSSSGGIPSITPIQNFLSAQNPNNSPRNSSRNSPRAGHASSPRLSHSKSQNYSSNDRQNGSGNRNVTRNNRNNNNNNSNNNNGRQRSKSELPPPNNEGIKQNWGKNQGNRGSLGVPSSSQGFSVQNSREKAKEKGVDGNNFRRRARSSSGSNGLPKPIFDQDGNNNLSTVAEVVGERENNSSSESPPPSTFESPPPSNERWDEDIFDLETDSPKMNTQSNSKSLTPHQKIQQIQQQQMFSNFGGMRIGNNNNPSNGNPVKSMNNNGSNGMYGMNIPIHHSQSLPNHFYDGNAHSPHQYQSWVPPMSSIGMVQNPMTHMSGSPYGHYIIPPPNGFAHLSIPPSMLQQNQQSSPHHRK